MPTTSRPNALAITAAPLPPAGLFGHVASHTAPPACTDELTIPGVDGCRPCRCVKHAGHNATASATETATGHQLDPDADHQCACGGRWDDPTEPNTAEPHEGR